MESTRANQMRAQRTPSPETKLRQVDKVRNRVRVDSELSKNLYQIVRGNDYPIGSLKNKAARAESAEVIASFSAAIVDQGLFVAQSCHKPCGRRSQQKRPIGGREDVRN